MSLRDSSHHRSESTDDYSGSFGNPLPEFDPDDFGLGAVLHAASKPEADLSVAYLLLPGAIQRELNVQSQRAANCDFANLSATVKHNVLSALQAALKQAVSDLHAQTTASFKSLSASQQQSILNSIPRALTEAHGGMTSRPQHS